MNADRPDILIPSSASLHISETIKLLECKAFHSFTYRFRCPSAIFYE